MHSNLTIDFWKKLLLKCFIVSFALHVISFILWFLMRDFSFAITHQLFALDQAAYNKIVIDFFVASKFFIFYVFLTPALALYWVAKCNKAEWKKNIKLDDKD